MYPHEMWAIVNAERPDLRAEHDAAHAALREAQKAAEKATAAAWDYVTNKARAAQVAALLAAGWRLLPDGRLAAAANGAFATVSEIRGDKGHVWVRSTTVRRVDGVEKGKRADVGRVVDPAVLAAALEG